MDAHAQLDEGGEGHEGEDGGEGHMVGEVECVTLTALILDHAVAGPKGRGSSSIIIINHHQYHHCHHHHQRHHPRHPRHRYPHHPHRRPRHHRQQHRHDKCCGAKNVQFRLWLHFFPLFQLLFLAGCANN